MIQFAWINSAFSLELERMKGFVSPTGTINLIESSSEKIKLSFVDFFSTRLDERFTDGIIQILEHDFMFRPGYKNSFDILHRTELNKIVLKEFKGEDLTPYSAPRLKSFLDIDYLVFIDERLEDRTWFWNVRIYSARSGVFVADTKIEYRDYHLRWTLNDLLKQVKNIIKPENSPQNSSSQITSEVLLPESVKKFSQIRGDCEDGKCLHRLEDLEWIQKNNPDFLDSITKDSFYLNMLNKEANTPIEFARVNFLSNTPLQGGLKLELYLSKIRRMQKRIEALKLISRSAIETNRQSKAKESSDALYGINRYDEDALYTRAWVFKQEKKVDEAIGILESVLKRNSDNIKAARLLIECYQIRNSKEDKGNIYQTKRKIAFSLFNLGNKVDSSTLFMELLDEHFDLELLNNISMPLLSSMEKKNLATLLNQQALKIGLNEAQLYYQLTRLKYIDKQYDEASQILGGALQQFPKDKTLLDFAIWQELKTKKEAIHAQRLLERLPIYRQDPFLTAKIYEKLGKFEKAADVWKRTIWPKGWKFEAILQRANLNFKLKKYGKVLGLVSQAEKIYNSREDLFKLKMETLKQLGKKEEAEKAQIQVWQLSGREINTQNTQDHLFVSAYKRLIAPHPIASYNGKDLVIPPKTIVLNATLPEKKDSLAFMKTYLPKRKDRLVKEIKAVLSERYNTIDNTEQEARFRKHLAPEDPGHKSRYNKSDLLELMNQMGTNSAFFVNYRETPLMSESKLQIEVKLYYFDGISNSIYMTSSEHTVPFFEVYKFNMYFAALPAAILAILIMSFFHFTRLTQPLSYAKHLINNKHFAKAAEVLERFGYQQDHRRILAHLFANKKNYLRAYENFILAKDYENAVVALKGCPDNEDINNSAAEMFLQLKEYDKASHFYMKNNNLLGLAKVRNAQGHKQSASKILGQYYFENNNPMAAIEEFRKVGEYERAGLVLYYHRKYQEAAVMFRQSSNKEMYRKCLIRAGEKAVSKKRV